MNTTTHWIGLVLFFCLIVCRPRRAGAETSELLVPAYANPNTSTSNGLNMWNNLIATSGTIGSDLNIVLNPASGPGASPIE